MLTQVVNTLSKSLKQKHFPATRRWALGAFLGIPFLVSMRDLLFAGNTSLIEVLIRIAIGLMMSLIAIFIYDQLSMQVSTSDDGIEYKRLGTSLHTNWKNISKITGKSSADLVLSFHEAIMTPQGESIHSISLNNFQNWRHASLGKAIEKHAPHALQVS